MGKFSESSHLSSYTIWTSYFKLYKLSPLTLFNLKNFKIHSTFHSYVYFSYISSILWRKYLITVVQFSHWNWQTVVDNMHSRHYFYYLIFHWLKSTDGRNLRKLEQQLQLLLTHSSYLKYQQQTTFRYPPEHPCSKKAFTLLCNSGMTKHPTEAITKPHAQVTTSTILMTRRSQETEHHQPSLPVELKRVGLLMEMVHLENWFSIHQQYQHSGIWGFLWLFAAL